MPSTAWYRPATAVRPLGRNPRNRGGTGLPRRPHTPATPIVPRVRGEWGRPAGVCRAGRCCVRTNPVLPYHSVVLLAYNQCVSTERFGCEVDWRWAAEGPDSQAGVGLRGDGRGYLLTLNLNSAVTPYPLVYPVVGTGVIPGEAVVGWRVGVPGQYRNPLRDGTERRSDDHHGRELIGDIIYRCIPLRLSIRSYRITHNRYRFPINPVVQPRPSSHHPHNRRRSSRGPGVAPLVEWYS